MTQSSIIESFRQYFSVETAVTQKMRERIYGIRYRVYCEEFQYEPADRFDDEMEVDEFDERSMHCLIVHQRSGMPAGCVRIVLGSTDTEFRPLPFEKFCSESIDSIAFDALRVPGTDYCEASRFAVDGAFRRRSGETLTRFGEVVRLNPSKSEQRTFSLIAIALFLAAAAMAELCGRPAVFSVMEPFLPRLLKRSGMQFERMGRDMNYHGIRALYVTDTRQFVKSIEGEMQSFYCWISDQLRESAGDHLESIKTTVRSGDSAPP